jgi:hypothetical protein
MNYELCDVTKRCAKINCVHTGLIIIETHFPGCALITHNS